MTDWAILDQLAETIAARAGADPDSSYVARLLQKGKAAQKVGEEGLEAALAAAKGDRTGLVGESADLLFHLLVLWKEQGVTADEVLQELARREGVSGLTEKASRKD